MQRYLKAMVVLCALAAASTAAWAQPYYARGDFNGWGTSDVLTDMGGGHWMGTVGGVADGSTYEYKLASADWSQNWPGSNGKIQGNAGGTATFHLWLTPPADGWTPSSGARVGYDDLGWGWDVMGAFNGWGSPVVVLANMGGGLYSGDYSVASPGTYEFKFRKAGDWGISIGDNFGNSAANLSFTTTNPNEVLRFELDLPNGRNRVTVVPEPATLMLLVGGLLAVRRSRRA